MRLNKIFGLIVCLLIFCIISSCGKTSPIEEWKNSKGAYSENMEVTVTKIINPALAEISDGINTVNIFGIIVDGTGMDITSSGLQEGDVIVIKPGKYNVYEGSVEMQEPTLIEKK